MSTTGYSKYGTTERKKQDIDSLTQQVLTAQLTVAQQQAIVHSLTEKSNKLQADVTISEANKTTALQNKNLVAEIVENLLSLKKSTEITFNETVKAEAKIKRTSEAINQLIQELIFSAEIINKLQNLIIRKKAMNPLISDTLVSMITQAVTDANNAVALTLVALQTVFSAQASTKTSEVVVSLEVLLSTELYELVIGENTDTIKSEKPLTKETSISGLLKKAYDIQVQLYNQTLIASKDVLQQLHNATRELSVAETNLSSLQAGLAAAKAAALAS